MGAPMSMANPKKPSGPVQVDKDPYAWKTVFRQKIVEAFMGQKPTEAEIKAKVPEVSTATTAAMGYSLEEAQKEDVNELAISEVSYHRKPEAETELENTSPEDM